MHSTTLADDAAAPRRPATKGEATRAAILDAALGIASRDGMEGLTIGMLAERMGMSKSGVFSHFGSRTDLQLAVLQEYSRRFVAEVLEPAVRKPRGLARLRELLERWLRRLAREIEAGCILIGAASEYDDRPGPMHDALAAVVGGWKAELLRAVHQARDSGELGAGIDCDQLVFEIYGLMLMFHQDARLLHGRDSVRRVRAGLDRLLEGAATGRRASRH
jgi:AcrR family transcriptional regulator